MKTLRFFLALPFVLLGLTLFLLTVVVVIISNLIMGEEK